MSAPDADLIAALTAAMLADDAVKAVLGDPVRLYAERSRSAAYPHASWGRSETLARDADERDRRVKRGIIRLRAVMGRHSPAS